MLKRRRYNYSKVGPLSLAFMRLVPVFAERPPFWDKVNGTWIPRKRQSNQNKFVR